MSLADYLSEGVICTDMAAQDRDEALRELLMVLVEAGQLEQEQVEPMFEALRKREMLGSTAIGNGVAVPHARLEGLGGTLVSLGVSRAGLPFNALDGAGVHEVFLVIAPENDADEYLEVMKRVSRLVQDRDFRSFIKQAKSEQEIIDLVKEMDD